MTQNRAGQIQNPARGELRTVGRGWQLEMGVDGSGVRAYKRYVPALTQDQQSFNHKIVQDSGGQITPEPPKLPDDVKARFPSLKDYERRMKDYMQKQVGQPQ